GEATSLLVAKISRHRGKAQRKLPERNVDAAPLVRGVVGDRRVLDQRGSLALDGTAQERRRVTVQKQEAGVDDEVPAGRDGTPEHGAVSREEGAKHRMASAHEGG